MRFVCLFALGAAFFIVQPDRSVAATAIAFGYTGSLNDGFVWGSAGGDDRITKALSFCAGTAKAPGSHPSNAPKAENLCRIVAEGHDKCFAISQDGNATTPAHGYGWADGADLSTAKANAISKCSAMAGPKWSSGCAIDWSYCDGNAK